MATIYDVSKKTGFSSTTVSKALNGYPDISEKTKKIIRLAAKDLGYTPNAMAKGLRDKKSWLVGVVVKSDLDVDQHFLSIIESFRKEMEKYGYDVIFVNQSFGQKNMSYYEHCLNRNIEGVLILSTGKPDKNILTLSKSNIPMVTTDNNNLKIPSINCDNYGGTKDVIRYLYDMGHSNIGMLVGPLSTLAGEERYRSFIDSTNNLGIEINENWIIEGDNFTFDCGYKAMKKILTSDKLPTAIFASADLMAYGAIVAATEIGLSVPEDLSIIGFDDIYSSKFYNPGLTTIRQDQIAMGKCAAEKLQQIITGKKNTDNTIIPVGLIFRDSCKHV